MLSGRDRYKKFSNGNRTVNIYYKRKEPFPVIRYWTSVKYDKPLGDPERKVTAIGKECPTCREENFDRIAGEEYE